MYKPSFSEAKKISEGYTIIPVSCEIFADTKTPIAVLQSIKAISSQYYLLESVENGEKWGRYSFLGFNPIVELKCKDGVLDIKGTSHVSHMNTDDPGSQIRSVLSQYKSPRLEYLPPFTGGFAGYFAYDYIKYSEETLKLSAVDDTQFYDVDLMLFDKVIAFDHFKQKIIVIINIRTDNLEENYEKGILELENIINLINSYVPATSSPSRLLSPFTPAFSKEEYCEIVKKVKHYIYEGDIFQAVPSNRRAADFEGSLFDTYRTLRTTNPSPYMFFLKFDDVEITGTSPETLIKLEDGNLSTFPIAGTRPRGNSEEADSRLIEQLLSDEKELSEHNMLVDLGRNDLGKISEFGSVEVKDYLSIRKYSHVIHIESKVTGKLRKGLDQLDAISALLPAGTLSGAPKIRACQIINEVEGHKRGIYGGAIGYIDFTGNMDTCIAIRMAVLKNNKVYVQSGGGIVADSVPETEYAETAHKAQAIINAIEASVRGIK
ncbi:anthranilate synthase component 1 [Ruminiclostridium sufflavum DSM 19573]|uniref:Anthranilate synthase component 1 n=1 Tax=Ruminiclostridium sufflavum DSM 19573 TaxID=1121337 RepID=A0A318XHB4_9FIRM|nr:anthranilate synthase component I [Ruminiclostridium sufflavum]PYG85819.1 anthranilate synthase component 1 [Ruminiclostridium sufflavum DSM 19573]